MENNQNQGGQAQMPNEPMKICKGCNIAIPKKAKVCPNCYKKQGGIVKWIVIAVVVICVIGAAVGASKEDEIKKVDSTSENTPQQENTKTESNKSDSAKEDTEKDQVDEQKEGDLKFKAGETAEYQDVKVTLTNVAESNGSEYNKPDSGNVFVLAEFEIENNSDEELAISSMLSFDAYQDGYATSLSLSALMEKDGEQIGGSIAPGKKMKGCVGYEVPSGYKELEINVQLDVWSSKKIIFVYNKL